MFSGFPATMSRSRLYHIIRLRITSHVVQRGQDIRTTLLSARVLSVLILLELGSALSTPSEKKREHFMKRMKMSGTWWEGRRHPSCSYFCGAPERSEGALFLSACSCGRTLAVAWSGSWQQGIAASGHSDVGIHGNR